MEQMYLIEIFIDKVTIFVTDEDKGTAKKNLIMRVKFGPKVQFIIKEGQLAVNDKKDDIIDTDENGRRKFSRTIRVGKSYLFPSYPDTILMILSKFPLEIEVWNDDDTETENQMFIGVGNMHWDTQFFHMLKETSDSCKIHEPLAIKTMTTLMAECCCKQAGEIYFILRLSALGDSIITEFQQPMKDPDAFVFRTNKAPSMFQCKRIEGDNPNFCMVGSLYETTTLEDPDIIDVAQNKIEICTELQSCAMGKDGQYVCEHDEDKSGPPKKRYPIDKIRMGDIVGPCGNANCALAHKVRKYIRNLDSYKGKAAAAGISGTKSEGTRKICGTCVCKDDRWHRDECPSENAVRVRCEGCEGIVMAGHTCKDKKDKFYGTGMTPKTSEKQVCYVYSITNFPNNNQGVFGQDSIVENCYCTKLDSLVNFKNKFNSSDSGCQASSGGCCCGTSTNNKSITKPFDSKITMFSAGTNNPMIYNAANTTKQTNSSNTGTNPVTYNVGTSTGSGVEKRKLQVYNCTEVREIKDCKCNPKKTSPPCRTFDCECLTDMQNIASRKNHRPYCPVYKHKENCPVTMMHEEEDIEKKKLEEDEDETTPLPYGLPPIQLGPCPILGRPCTVPDGFARMYKNAQLPTQPFSYSSDGKVCCSKEYERIKKAIREYMKNDKDNDFRCINKFNVDTERRCCDKEQVLLSLVGRACCGSHKLAIQEKYAGEKKQP